MITTRLALAAAIAVASSAMAFAPQASAADGTITINGKVIAQTCDVSGNGGGSDFTVTLPVVQTSDLGSSAKTAGDTQFTMALSNCPTTPSGIQVGTQFYSSDNADANGRLANTAATTPANNVVVQLLDSSSNPIVVATSQSAAVVTDPTTLAGTTATLQYTARYYATAAATAGNVSTTVEYAINYQ